MNGLLADRRVETHRLLDSVGRCLGAAHHFHKWNDMGRIERVTDNDPLRVLTSRLHHAWGYSRRTRGDYRIDGGRLIHIREQLYFEVRSLGAVFLDEVGLRKRLLRVFGKAQAV